MGRQSIKDRRLVTRLRGWGPGNTDASSFPPRKKNRAGYDETRIKREQTKKIKKNGGIDCGGRIDRREAAPEYGSAE